MNNSTTWPKVAVVGAGAVGGYFGGMLARAGAPVTMIGRQAFVDAVKGKGLFLDTLQFQEAVHVDSGIEMSAAREAEMILFCVKTTDTETAARELAPFVAPKALVVSMQNGVDNAERIYAASGIDALPAAVYVAASVPDPGRIKHVGGGILIIGPQSECTEKVAALFERPGVPCRISDNIPGELWAKLVLNCATNAISALGRVTYGEIAANEDARRLATGILTEVLAVARAAGIRVPGMENPETGIAEVLRIATFVVRATSSMAQDLEKGKRTEIDSLNGYVARRGQAFGVPTPVNHALYTLVKLAEGPQS